MTPQRTERAKGVVRFEVRWREGTRHRSRSFDTEGEALDWEAELRRRKRMGAHAGPEPSRDPFQRFLERWWESNKGGWSDSHRARQGAVIRKWVVPYLGHVPFADVGPERLDEWKLDILAKGCPASSYNRARTAVSAAFGWAVKMRLLPYNPMVAVEKLPERKRKREPVPVEVIEAVRVHLEPIDAFVVSLMAYAGLRPDEPLALRWENVGATSLYLGEDITKTHRSRTVDLDELTAAEAEALRPGKKARGLVRPNAAGAKVRLDNWRPRVLGTAIEKAEAEHFTPYRLRHTCASLLIHQGEPLTYVAAQLGHSVEVLSDHYAHIVSEYRRGSGPVPMTGVIAEARAGVLQVPVREVYEGNDVPNIAAARGGRRDRRSQWGFR